MGVSQPHADRSLEHLQNLDIARAWWCLLCTVLLCHQCHRPVPAPRAQPHRAVGHRQRDPRVELQPQGARGWPGDLGWPVTSLLPSV